MISPAQISSDINLRVLSKKANLDTDKAFYATAFNPSQPLTTPAGLNTTTATPLKWLADAVLNLQAHHVALDAGIGQVQHAPQSTTIHSPEPQPAFESVSLSSPPIT